MPLNDNSSAIADLARLGREQASGGLVTRSFDVHGTVTRLTSDSEAVAGAVAGLLRSFEAGKKGQEAQIQVQLFSVDSLDERMAPIAEDAAILYDWGMVKVYHRGGLRHLALEDRARVTADLESRQAVGFVEKSALDSDWLISHLVFYPLWAQLLKEEGLFPFHAAGLSREGKAFLFPGASGSGKSTLSLHLVKAGFGLLSDDTVFLRETDGQVEALAFPEEINVTDGTVDLFPELGQVENFTANPLRNKSSFPIEELYPGSVIERSQPAILVFPRISDMERTVAQPMSRTEALALSMRYAFFFMDPSTTGRHFQLLSALVRQARCYRLYSGRDQDELGRAVEGLFTESQEDSQTASQDIENQSPGERKE